ncbi:MAG: hypothetical protein HQM08_00005 [Candidatus Riflebacteria bacterium]|nr:hypothetical protein [Candidatus Riflebacteria bacterium]
MRKVLLTALLAFALVVPSFAQDAAATAAPTATAVAAPAPAPAKDAPAAAPAKDAPAAAVAKLEGTIVVTKGAEGAPDTYMLKTAAGDLVLLPGDKLEELKKVADFEKKTFVVEGEKVPSKDKKAEGLMIKSFEEKK